jgi:hypothetical protein
MLCCSRLVFIFSFLFIASPSFAIVISQTPNSKGVSPINSSYSNLVNYNENEYIYSIPVSINVILSDDGWICNVIPPANPTASVLPEYGVVTFKKMNGHVISICGFLETSYYDVYYKWIASDPNNDSDYFEINGVYSVDISLLAYSELRVINPYYFGANVTSISNFDILRTIIYRTEYENRKAVGIDIDGTNFAVGYYYSNIPHTVELTIVGPSTLMPFNSKHMNTPVRNGSRLLKFQEHDFIDISTLDNSRSGYFVPFIVQSSTDRNVSFETIIINARSKLYNKQNFLKPSRPPVLFVHGLWGNARSFSFFASRLSNAGVPATAVAIYPGNIAYDDIEVQRSVWQTTRTLLNQRVLMKFASARVDVVAHSMGGLVVRKYSSRSD